MTLKQRLMKLRKEVLVEIIIYSLRGVIGHACFLENYGETNHICRKDKSIGCFICKKISKQGKGENK